MQKKLLIALGIFLLLGITSIYFQDVLIVTIHKFLSNEDTSKKCSRLSEDYIKKEIDAINSNHNKYTQMSRKIWNVSAEGGMQTNYTDDKGAIRLIQQVFYGETGKSEASYYLDEKGIFFISKYNFTYEKPISIDSSVKIIKTEKKDFYLGENDQLCTWYLNGALQQNDADTRSLVDFLISKLEINEKAVSCPVLSIADVRKRIAEIDSNRDKYIQQLKDVPKLTSRGGTQINYTNHEGSLIYVHQIFYDEAFRSEISYYLSNKKVFFITVDRIVYEKPIYLDSKIRVNKIITRDFYLNEDEEVCSWYLDNAEQPIDKETKEFVSFLLSAFKK